MLRATSSIRRSPFRRPCPKKSIVSLQASSSLETTHDVESSSYSMISLSSIHLPCCDTSSFSYQHSRRSHWPLVTHTHLGLQAISLHRHPTATFQKRTKVFVSKHNHLNLSPQAVTSYLTQQFPHLTPNDFRITSSHVILRECCFCSKPTGGKTDNEYKLYISSTGAYFCHRCGAKGSWYDLKSTVGGFSVDAPTTISKHNGEVSNAWNWSTTNNNGMKYVSSKSMDKTVECLPMPPKKVVSLHSTRLFDSTSDESSQEYAALEYLVETRGLSKSVLRKYGVGCCTHKFPSKEGYVGSMCVTFPWLMREAEIMEQEELRGATYHWKNTEESNGTNKDGKERAKESVKIKQKKLSEMSALDRHLLRQQRKDKARMEASEDVENNKEHVLSRSTVDAMLKGAEYALKIPPNDESATAEDINSRCGPYIPRRIKVRSIEKKSWQRLDPPGGGFGLFGWHTVPHDATEIIITEGEFDAMAVYQATGRPSVSLPNGCRSLPMEVLVLLERFDTVYLWMDNDGPGREGAEMFARKMGVERCLLVQPGGVRGQPMNLTTTSPPKDANEALLQGWDIEELLAESSELPHERILKFSDLRDQVLHEIIHPERYRGSPIPSLPGFTSLIKGFRRGEMTVLTGPTGSGKTTFLGQASLDLAEQGINVLWGSFEIKNTRLMHKLLQQYMKDVLPVGVAEKDMSIEEKQKAITSLAALADKFETLPMYFMKFHGGSDVDDVLDAMEYAAYVHDVEHIILDNMQFMISRQGSGPKGSSHDKFEMQDIAIEKFRKFATEYNVHVTLVVHPRKEDEGAKLGISSFYGSAKATQEADTVIILQNDGNRKFLDVKKNRFDGTIGHVPLHFQRKSGRYSETPEFVAAPTTKIPTMPTSKLKAKASAPPSVYQSIRDQHPV